MELVIKHEFGNYYLIADYVGKINEDYLVRMITENSIKGHVLCKESFEGNKKCLMYNVTNMIPISSEFENRYLELEDIYDLFESIKNIYSVGARHLLDDRYYYLNPKFIYKDIVDDEIKLLYIPGYEEYEKGRYYELADFLMQRINRKDETCIQLAYQFYRMCVSETFSVSMFISIIEKEITMNKKHVVLLEDEQPIENNNPVEETKQSVTFQWMIPMFCSILEILLLALYFVYFRDTVYSLYALIGVVAVGMLASFLWVSTIYKYYVEKDESEIIMPKEPVTVEQYWNDEDTVVLQENTVVLRDTFDEILYKLEWKEKGILKKYVINKFPIVIGKMQEEVDCFIDDSSISRLHAKIIQKGAELIIFDLNSTNGTSIDGIKIKAGEEGIINSNSRIKLGNVVLSIVC